ncbi:ABC transporter ATP-binding protein [Martelella sp. HB161492]|uniref:ABC transporter ATP-binding protein n=1 Tax=Martelella sp. HB161492 TaxID=2720726 RepID=UPI001591B8B0|nr:ABC transporter ATP-binding protein [Martelella sp. HB161492]
MAKLELKDIAKSYGHAVAVQDVSLEIASGELVCLLGPSGSGKSTLLRIIGGFERPSAGQVLIDGADVTASPPERRPTAMVFQSHALWSHMSVYDNIAFGLKLRKLPRAEIRRKVETALELVGLGGYADRSPVRLSGGQQQRVAIARCIVLEPKILLMDEPFASLDQHLRERLREEVRNIQRELGITTVFVTHGQDEALAIADRIVVMSVGKVNQIGAPADIYADPCDTFVAGFIGAMNLIEGHVSGGKVRAGGFDLSVPFSDGPATLAMRPERLVLCGADAAAARVRVDRVIHFGTHLIIEAEGEAGQRLKIQSGTDAAVRAGEHIHLRPQHYSVFRDGEDVYRSNAASGQ